MDREQLEFLARSLPRSIQTTISIPDKSIDFSEFSPTDLVHKRHNNNGSSAITNNTSSNRSFHSQARRAHSQGALNPRLLFINDDYEYNNGINYSKSGSTTPKTPLSKGGFPIISK